MLSWVVTFLIIALVAGLLGFGGIAGASMEIAKIVFFVAIVLFAVVGLFAEMGIRSQIGRIAKMARRLGAGDLTARVAPPYPGGELGSLLTVLNHTAASLERPAFLPTLCTSL